MTRETPAFTVLTYATHSEGLYDRLVKDVPWVQVGGWGRQWKGFLQKFEYVLDFARECEPSHVLIFVDGFDTEVAGCPEEAVNRFLDMGVPFLVSSLGAETLLPSLLQRRVFGCGSDQCANTGLYMGYADAVRQVLEAALSMEHAHGDDQRALGLARSTDASAAALVHIDVDCRIFMNLNARERMATKLPPQLSPVFVGRNGSGVLLSWRARRRWVCHFSRLLATDAALCVLVSALGALWGSGALPTPCCFAMLFPAVVALACLFSPTFSITQVSGLFLLSLFALFHALFAA